MCTFSNITQCTIKILPLYSHSPPLISPSAPGTSICLDNYSFVTDLLNYYVFHTKCNLQTLKFISTNLKD